MARRETVVIADDHPVFRRGLIGLIEEESNMDVVGEAENGQEVFALLEAWQPDIAILDIAMPGSSGLEVTEKVRTDGLPLRIIILTMYDDIEYLERAIELDVDGYLLKENATLELIQCLEVVADGGRYTSQAMMDALQAAQSAERRPRITPTEEKILRLIAQGKTSKEIAIVLGISYRTVQNHRANLGGKLGLKGVNQLLKYSVERFSTT